MYVLMKRGMRLLANPRQPIHNVHAFHADGYKPFQQADYVVRVIAPLVGVICYVAVPVCFYLIALHYPFNGGFAIHYVVVGLRGYARAGSGCCCR